jgi:DNA-binding XRE family transcriptional regulator
MNINTGVEIAIGLLEDYRRTGDLGAITHADMIIHSVAMSRLKEKPGPENKPEQPGEKAQKGIYKEIGKRIHKFRMATGRSQEALGQLLGLSRLAVNGYETGRTRISLSTLYRIADIFDKPIFDFLP